MHRRFCSVIHSSCHWISNPNLVFAPSRKGFGNAMLLETTSLYETWPNRCDWKLWSINIPVVLFERFKHLSWQLHIKCRDTFGSAFTMVMKWRTMQSERGHIYFSLIFILYYKLFISWLFPKKCYFDNFGKFETLQKMAMYFGLNRPLITGQ